MAALEAAPPVLLPGHIADEKDAILQTTLEALSYLSSASWLGVLSGQTESPRRRSSRGRRTRMKSKRPEQPEPYVCEC